MKKKPVFATPVIGASSLLVIFAVLALTVFALLSLSTVKAQQRLQENAQASIVGYYQADYQAETILAQLRAGERPQGVQCSNDIYSYTCPISQNQALEVEVRVQGQTYEILRWQAVSITDWQAEDSLPVWQGT